MTAVTICSDFGVQENKVSHCFHCFCIDLLFIYSIYIVYKNIFIVYALQFVFIIYIIYKYSIYYYSVNSTIYINLKEILT